MIEQRADRRGVPENGGCGERGFPSIGDDSVHAGAAGGSDLFDARHVAMARRAEEALVLLEEPQARQQDGPHRERGNGQDEEVQRYMESGPSGRGRAG